MAEAADGAESIDAAAGVDSQCAGSPITRARKNLAALEALAAAEERGSATAEEIAAMEAYSGWGGAQKAFSENAEGEWGEIRDRLKELLSDDEFASQRHTVLTAFYTPAPVIGAIYDALREAGIGHGDTPAAILEPGCGTGNFMRLAPADLALDFHGVELDPISARIAQALCPEAHITAAGLEECRVSPASFDAAIGNVPYSGDIKIDGMPIHDYFIKKSVEAVRPGGVVAVLTSRYTLDKNSTATRRALAEQAELLGAVRLPAETFKRQAGTEALSDILLLRRRPEPIALADDELPEWVETSPFEDTVNINRYFNEHPGRAVGDMSIVSGPMGPTLGVSFKGGADALGDRVSDLLRDSVDRGGAVEMAAVAEPAGISVVPTAPTKFEFSVAADGTIWYGTEDAVEPFTPGGGKTGPERARAMLSLRDGARALLALERDPGADDDEVEEAIARLSAEYDSFFERYSRINSKKNLAVFPSKGFTDHSLALNLLSLEKVDSNGEVTGKADILKKRLVTPEAPTPEHVGNPADALAVTIDARGGVDMDFLADGDRRADRARAPGRPRGHRPRRRDARNDRRRVPFRRRGRQARARPRAAGRRARARGAPDPSGLERTPWVLRRCRRPARRRPQRARAAAQDALMGEQPEPHHLALRGGRLRACRRPRPRRPPHQLGLLAAAHPPRARGIRRAAPDRCSRR